LKIEPKNFEKMLKVLSLYEAGKGYIDPLEINFSNDEIKVQQADSSFTTAVIAKYPVTYFSDYETIGTKRLNVDYLVKTLSKYFKADSTINVEFGDDELILRGEMETFEDAYSTYEICKFESNIILEDWGFITDKMNLKKGYKIDSAFLKDISNETIIFEYGKELKVIVESDNRRYTRKIPIVSSIGEDEGRRMISGDIFGRIASNTDGNIWIVFTQEPVIFTQTLDKAIITYIVAPMVM